MSAILMKIRTIRCQGRYKTIRNMVKIVNKKSKIEFNSLNISHLIIP